MVKHFAIAKFLVKHAIAHTKGRNCCHIDGHMAGLCRLAHSALTAALLQAPPAGGIVHIRFAGPFKYRAARRLLHRRVGA